MTARNADLQARLDVFIHDPYIKKGLSDTRQDVQKDIREDIPEDTEKTPRKGRNKTPVKRLSRNKETIISHP